ncbi:hypothetical protein FOL47_002124, partial [Perkinsus chesapeaki]
MISLLAQQSSFVSLASEVAACGAFSLICDEARDIAHTERLSVCVRYMYDAQIKEEFPAFVRCEKLDAANLTEEIFRTLGEVGIHPSLMVSQCYDGASVMSGAVSGVAQRVRERANEARSAIYIHCFAHRVNLVVVEVCRAERFSGLFQVCQDLHRFLASSIVNPVFKKSQQDSNPGKQPRMVPSLSETRWVCQFRALVTAIFETLEVFPQEEGGDRGGTAQGLRLRLNAEFMVNLVTMRWVLNVTADVAESLQDKEHTLAQGLADIDAALTRLHRPSPTEDDEVWDLLWYEANRLIRDLGLPILARRVRRRARPVLHQAGVSREDFRKNMFIPLCKSVRWELFRRFKAPENEAVYKGVLSMTPGSPRFLNEEDLIGIFCHYYPDESAPSRAPKLEVALLRDVLQRGGEDLPEDLRSFYSFLLPQERVLPNM